MDSDRRPDTVVKCRCCDALIDREGLCASCEWAQRHVLDTTVASPMLPVRRDPDDPSGDNALDRSYPDLQRLRREVDRLGIEIDRLNAPPDRAPNVTEPLTGVRSMRFVQMLSITLFGIGVVVGIVTVLAMTALR